MLPLTRNRGPLAVFEYYMMKWIILVRIDVLHFIARIKKVKQEQWVIKLCFCLTVAYL